MNSAKLKAILDDHRLWTSSGWEEGFRAVLSGADLIGADLIGADLIGADLRGAVLRGAVLRGADLIGADLRGVIGVEAPPVENLDARILGLIDSGEGELDMGRWHGDDGCATTHCRAGWAITLAGDAGRKLEGELGPAAAGALIYHASAGYVPDFYASDKEALADLRARAGKAALRGPTGGEQ